MAEDLVIRQSRIPRILDFPEPEGQVILEYIFFGNTKRFFTKTRVVNFEPKSPDECPMWDDVNLELNEVIAKTGDWFDIHLKPVALYRDPFRKGKNKLVLCEALKADKTPTENNTRAKCRESMEKFKDEQAWFGMEQEYLITDMNDWPFGFSQHADFRIEDCHAAVSYGPSSGLERQVAEAHLQACIYAGLNMWGICKEDVPAVWEFQLAPCDGLQASDQLMIARYILMRVAELFGVKISFSCGKHWYDSYAGGLHVFQLNFSTRKMREEGGLTHLYKTIDRISKVPQEKLLKYFDTAGGRESHLRLIGHNYCPKPEFSWAVGDKWNCSIRIPLGVADEGRGYFEERRLAPDIDPYMVTGVYIKAALEDNSTID